MKEKPYENDFLWLWNSRGIKVDKYTTENAKAQIIEKVIKENAGNRDKSIDWIWYCFNNTRFQGSEINFCRKLANTYSIKEFSIIFVETQAMDEESSEKMKANIQTRMDREIDYVLFLVKVKKFLDIKWKVMELMNY